MLPARYAFNTDNVINYRHAVFYKCTLRAEDKRFTTVLVRVTLFTGVNSVTVNLHFIDIIINCNCYYTR